MFDESLKLMNHTDAHGMSRKMLPRMFSFLYMPTRSIWTLFCIAAVCAIQSWLVG